MKLILYEENSFHGIFRPEFYEALLSYIYTSEYDTNLQLDACRGTNSTCGVDIEVIKQLVCILYTKNFELFLTSLDLFLAFPGLQ